jgi:hypothetical protein
MLFHVYIYRTRIILITPVNCPSVLHTDLPHLCVIVLIKCFIFIYSTTLTHLSLLSLYTHVIHYYCFSLFTIIMAIFTTIFHFARLTLYFLLSVVFTCDIIV